MQEKTTENNQQIIEQLYQGRVVLIDKPLKWTSFDIVKKIKALLRHKLGIKKIKIGHAGTLDPLASGLLIICTGRMTKKIDSFQMLPKTYTGTFFLGASTPSYDLETKPDIFASTENITHDKIKDAAQSLSGEQMQVPPLFSAKKIQGERAYYHARRGQETVLEAKKIHVYDFDITEIRLPEVYFRIKCSRGTYIRSLAHDLGEKLDNVAYLQSLRRTKIGDFNVEDAVLPDNLDQYILNL